MRTFIAITLPQDIKQYLATVKDRCSTCDLDAKWVKPENLHITLKFLGQTSSDQLSSIKEALNTVTVRHEKFEVALKNFGFFPNERRPRVFFVATSEEAKLREIASSTEELLESTGFPGEERFRSHVTLARIKSIKNIDRLREKLKEVSLEGSFLVDKITLMQSTLSSSGSIYKTLYIANLAFPY